jgi:hypothetical protein
MLFGSTTKPGSKKRKKASKKRAAKKTSKKKGGLFSPQEKVFRYEAKYLNRDIKSGSIQRSEIDDYIKASWDKDSDEFESQGIKSYSEFHSGVRKYVK